MVDRELEIDFDDLLRRRAIERDVTLDVRVERSRRQARRQRDAGSAYRSPTSSRKPACEPDADQLKSTSIDGWTSGTPVAAITDGRDAMLAFAMNGEPLPVEHGFPVRMVVPGLYGFVSATKWVVDLELTTFADFDAYWARRGWAQQAPIKTQSRIDAPKPLARVAAGPSRRRRRRLGAAPRHRRRRGARRRGSLAARRARRPSVRSTPGGSGRGRGMPPPVNHKLEVRATDANGNVQPEERVAPIPDGATGWHSVVVRVS